MLNYIKAELWKVSRRQVFYILLALLVLCTAVFTGTSSLKGFPSLAAAVSNTMITGFLAAPLLVQLVDGGGADTLKNELRIKTVIGIGTVSDHLRELADSYKEAQTAIDVGKVFDTEKSIIDYENLGIGRLIYQLPTTLCEIFLSEVFKKNSIDSLDQETLFTINKFFENNLNVSETSRKLFVHRNTLVYRLEKIKKLTGLDLRQFDHAIVFKVALMVRKYLTSRETR